MTPSILSITNHHLAAYGVPPDFQIGERDYVGYFENEPGEQWVFIYRSNDGKGWLWGGDMGWNNQKEVKDGLPPWTMGNAEAAWLAVCWRAATDGVPLRR